MISSVMRMYMHVGRVQKAEQTPANPIPTVLAWLLAIFLQSVANKCSYSSWSDCSIRREFLDKYHAN